MTIPNKLHGWTQRILKDKQRYFFHFQNKNFTSDASFLHLYYGCWSRGRAPGSRFCNGPLWIKQKDNSYEPIGFFLWKCTGFFKHDQEYGILYLGNQCIEASRVEGNRVIISYNGDEIGNFIYTPCSRLFYLGSGFFSSTTSNFSGYLYLPKFFVCSQFHVVKGMIFNTLRGKVKINGITSTFLLSQGGNFPEIPSNKITAPDIFHLMPQNNATSIFDKVNVDSISFSDKLILLFLFCRSIAFYMPGY